MCSCIGIEVVLGFAVDEEAKVVRRIRDDACGTWLSDPRVARWLTLNYDVTDAVVKATDCGQSVQATGIRNVRFCTTLGTGADSKRGEVKERHEIGASVNLSKVEQG
jgi:hypothetical protein